MNNSKWSVWARGLPRNGKSTAAETLLQKLKKLSVRAQIRSHSELPETKPGAMRPNNPREPKPKP